MSFRVPHYRFPGYTLPDALINRTVIRFAIRVCSKGDEASVEFTYLEATEAQPDVMVDLVLS